MYLAKVRSSSGSGPSLWAFAVGLRLYDQMPCLRKVFDVRKRGVTGRESLSGLVPGPDAGGGRKPSVPLLLAGLGLAAALTGGVAYHAWPGGTTEADPRGARARPTAGGSAGARPPTSAKPSSTPSVPASGPGTFSTARSDGEPVGSGPLRRYRVQVENGIDISAADAAAEIEKILAHPRGWAAHGRGRFQLVSSSKADFVIRIATPDTADRLCLAQGLNTRGELNCETVDGVVVNLRRWVLGSPRFHGPAADYRHLIINHEVGHEIGLRRHLGCSGPGRLAPVMMQQIKGLDGCLSNAWPYDEDGRYVRGPAV
jgi:hypothetical protein